MNDDNYLSKFVLRDFEPKHRVDTLDMTHSSLQRLTSAFGRYFDTHNLLLRYNNIDKFIPMDTPNYLNEITIDLRNNQLVCDCNMLWLKEHLQKQRKRATVLYTVSYCSNTLWHKSELIQSLPDDMFVCSSNVPLNSANEMYKHYLLH